jgi:hypothetical protein
MNIEHKPDFNVKPMPTPKPKKKKPSRAKRIDSRPYGQGKQSWLMIRVSEEFKSRCKTAAGTLGLSQWIINLCETALKSKKRSPIQETALQVANCGKVNEDEEFLRKLQTSLILDTKIKQFLAGLEIHEPKK